MHSILESKTISKDVCLNNDLLAGKNSFENLKLPFDVQKKLVLNHCIFSNVFTENTVNQRINAYDYGISESSDKLISFCTPGKDLGLSAAQSWCLARHILLIIRCDIPDINNYLK
jgi:hypothetical protein